MAVLVASWASCVRLALVEAMATRSTTRLMCARGGCHLMFERQSGA